MGPNLVKKLRKIYAKLEGRSLVEILESNKFVISKITWQGQKFLTKIKTTLFITNNPLTISGT